jgi:hypothetical protein
MLNNIRTAMIKHTPVLVGALTTATIYMNNEKNLKLTESIHKKDHDLEVKKFEFEQYKFSQTSKVMEDNSAISSTVSQVDNLKSQAVISSTNDSLSNLANIDTTHIPNSLELFNLLNYSILQSACIAFGLYAIGTLMAAISILVNNKMNQYGDKFEDKVPKWAKSFFKLWKRLLRYDNVMNFTIIILSQSLTLILAIYLFFRGTY